MGGGREGRREPELPRECVREQGEGRKEGERPMHGDGSPRPLLVLAPRTHSLEQKKLQRRGKFGAAGKREQV